uniref:Uncharacterized protein n=1 Tax=Cafeteria roenbergensis TaxID=33653 RepID=A0A7S0K0V9_CAFRO|mmetsp:Transcript_25199/g.95234  ORF Transcript_25199/g.95234 Transcript_25199/m.95234 type:complete len:119 (+) Transcript_25199:66-422(+)
MLALVATCSVSGPQKLRTALSLAAGLRDAATAGLLLDHGADLEVQDSYGQTPLMMAGSKNSVDVVLQLLDRGADHTVLDNNGRSAANCCMPSTSRNVLEDARSYRRWFRRRGLVLWKR